MIGTGGEIMDKKDCCCSERHKDRSEEEKEKTHEPPQTYRRPDSRN
mgnify:CR=1 FL=1